VGLGINILLALMVFLVLLADNTPPTSLAMPLITRYLVLVMLLCTFALCLTIFTCNLHLRTGYKHEKSKMLNRGKGPIWKPQETPKHPSPSQTTPRAPQRPQLPPYS
jgi:hypothetical protein